MPHTERECDVLAALTALADLEAERSRRLHLLDTHAVLRALVRRIRDEFGFDVGLVGLVENGDVVLRHWSGTRETSLHDLPVPLGLGLGGRVVAAGDPVAVPDYYGSDRITHDFDRQVRREGLRGMAGVPIGGGAVRGVLYGATRGPAGIGDVAVDGMRRLAAVATLAVDVADGAVTLAGSAVAEERRRLAESLHDSVGAMLFGIGTSLRRLRTAAGDAPVLSGRLELIERQLAQAGSALRESISRLRAAPVGPDPAHLAADIAASVRAFERRTGVPASFVPIGPPPPLDPERAALLVRAVDEALLNVEKHAGAQSVAVTLAAHGERASVAVMDDGTGIADESPGTGTGAGLPALRAAVERAGGHLHLLAGGDSDGDDDDSGGDNSGGGATLRCDLPLPRG
jgi:signal transduction histidine kinase